MPQVGNDASGKDGGSQTYKSSITTATTTTTSTTTTTTTYILATGTTTDARQFSQRYFEVALKGSEWNFVCGERG